MAEQWQGPDTSDMSASATEFDSPSLTSPVDPSTTRSTSPRPKPIPTGDQSETQDAVDVVKPQKRRGPYQKWLTAEPVIKIRTEPEKAIGSKAVKRHRILEKPDTGIRGCDSTERSPNDIAGGTSDDGGDDMGSTSGPEFDNVDDSIFDEYFPPVNDHEDEALDQLLNELRSEAQLEHQDADAEDTADPLYILTEEVIQAAEYKTEEMVSEEKATEDDPFLYPGLKRRLGIAVLLLVCFMVPFRLSDETMQHLLLLLQFLLPENNILVKSLYMLKKYLRSLTFLPEIHCYCSFCYHHIEKSAIRCPNAHCMKDLKQSGAVSYFVIHNLVNQLQVLFKRASFTEEVRSHRFSHYQANPHGNVRDVYDGILYRKLFEDGLLQEPNNISLRMNTDGVAIFKSSKVSMWPVYMVINELPLHKRKARENTLFYGIWISERKPMMWSFLKPLHDQLKLLESGISMVDHKSENFICKATLLTCTCDLPAKCLVSNGVQFNGRYDCWHCFQPGENFRTDAAGNEASLFGQNSF